LNNGTIDFNSKIIDANHGKTYSIDEQEEHRASQSLLLSSMENGDEGEFLLFWLNEQKVKGKKQKKRGGEQEPFPFIVNVCMLLLLNSKVTEREREKKSTSNIFSLFFTFFS
jgi:hypothetical protein